MAEKVRFEPTCRFRQNDFESFSLWPLRYFSSYIEPPGMNSEKGENSRREQAKVFNFQSAEKPYITPFERNFMFLNITGFRVLWLNQKLLYFGGKYENISEVKGVLKTHKIGVFGTLFFVITDKIKGCGDFRIWMEFCKNEGTLRELKHSPIIEH